MVAAGARARGADWSPFVVRDVGKMALFARRRYARLCRHLPAFHPAPGDFLRMRRHLYHDVSRRGLRKDASLLFLDADAPRDPGDREVHRRRGYRADVLRWWGGALLRADHPALRRRPLAAPAARPGPVRARLVRGSGVARLSRLWRDLSGDGIVVQESDDSRRRDHGVGRDQSLPAGGAKKDQRDFLSAGPLPRGSDQWRAPPFYPNPGPTHPPLPRHSPPFP